MSETLPNDNTELNDSATNEWDEVAAMSDESFSKVKEEDKIYPDYDYENNQQMNQDGSVTHYYPDGSSEIEE